MPTEERIGRPLCISMMQSVGKLLSLGVDNASFYLWLAQRNCSFQGLNLLDGTLYRRSCMKFYVLDVTTKRILEASTSICENWWSWAISHFFLSSSLSGIKVSSMQPTYSYDSRTQSQHLTTPILGKTAHRVQAAPPPVALQNSQLVLVVLVIGIQFPRLRTVVGPGDAFRLPISKICDRDRSSLF